ncbi:MAG: nitrous oxide reductase accessory protein NosL [Sulfurimonas sp.]|nr:nitrous oxide reductase accessory protein NosL [Sulfurimonas sp.]
MKTTLLIFLLILSLNASQEEHKRKIPSHIVDAKEYILVDSKKAFFILGSHKVGTMKEYFAFIKKEDAEEHVKKYGGCVVDYDTYAKMDDKEVEEYVKEHGIVAEKEKSAKAVDANNTADTNTTESDIYNKENMQKYKF